MAATLTAAPTEETRRARQVWVRPAVAKALERLEIVHVTDYTQLRWRLASVGMPEEIDERDLKLAVGWLCCRLGAQFRLGRPVIEYGDYGCASSRGLIIAPRRRLTKP
jgi:hypothetical protein